MTMRSRIISGLRRLSHKKEAEQELDEELRGYLEAAAEQKMLAGMTRDAAVRAARVDIGSLEAVKDRARDVGWESVVESLWQDMRYAVRMLRKSPGFTVVAVVTLALGIGMNTAIFSVVNSLLLRSLPVIEPQQLVTISSDFAISRGFTAGAGWNYGMWDRLRQRADVFDGGFAWSADRFNLAQAGEMKPVDGVYVSGGFFSTLGVRPVLGRALGVLDDQRGGGSDGPAVVISYGLWQRRFGGAASVIGMPLVLDGVSFAVVGVTPPGFFGIEVGRSFDVTLPLGTEPLLKGNDAAVNQPRRVSLIIMLRLKTRQSLDAATATLRTMQPQILEGFAGRVPPFLKDPFSLVPAGVGISSGLRQRYERPLLTILIVVAVVLLIACVNLANLLLARATARRHELSVRLALGASGWRLARQLLVESFILAGAGATFGLLLAVWGSRVLVSQISIATSPVVLDLALDWRVMAFTTVVTIVTVVLFGTAPAFRAMSVAPMDASKDQGRATKGATRANVSSGLVVAQTALSLALLIAAGLLVRTFDRLANVPLGFDPDRVLLVNVETAHARIDPANRNTLYHQLVRAVATAPGVAGAAGSLGTPAGGGAVGLIVNASGRADSERRVVADFVTPGWFAVYGIPFHAGRDIANRDTANALPVVVINNAFARRFFPGQSAIGEILVESEYTFLKGRTVIGVVGDAIYGSLRDAAPPTIYLPLAQSAGLEPPGRTALTISVHSVAGPPATLVPSVGAALTAADRDVAFSFRPLVDQVNASYGQERLTAALSAFFGALALMLAGVGLCGVTSYAVSRRRSEIGIRIALGAQPADVIKLILRQSILLTLVGVALGIAAAAALTRYLQTMLFGVTPLDPSTFIAVSLLFGAVATLAAYLPARRATKIDPMIALRCD
jgi:putative ABC transport system permease protein